jgi:NAD(P)-dependent dehydrogenase (short-subunit alcohol dehydrogenase family)
VSATRPLRFDGKVAVVTGGASGIGKATVLQFVAEGARVIIADANAARGAHAVEEAARGGDRDVVRFVETDVADEDQIVRMFDVALEAFGRLDCVFNNAGVPGALAPIVDTLCEEWDFTIDVVLRSVFLGIKHGGRIMQAQGTGGAIVNTASVAGVVGGGGPPVYSAAKAGVVSLTRSAAVELAADRIRVNAVCPGGVLTPLAHRGDPDAIRPRFDAMQPWPDHGQARDVASVVVFLASDDARFVSGDSINVDGALVANGIGTFSRANYPDAARIDHGTTTLAPGIRDGHPEV